jgi:uracil phosphoribosyltransferase
LVAYEATRDVRVDKVVIDTPVTKADGVKLSRPRPIIIPILRAGLGMLEGIVKLLPTAEVGFLGIKRNEETLQPYTYANRVPDDLTNRQVYIIDPMLGATDVTAICLIGAPEGLAAVEAHVHGKDVKIVLGALDEKLNEHGYIVPGLGDAGDRLYGLAE